MVLQLRCRARPKGNEVEEKRQQAIGFITKYFGCRDPKLFATRARGCLCFITYYGGPLLIGPVVYIQTYIYTHFY